jgi:hypothetical protein
MGPLFFISLLIHGSVRQLLACLICSTRNLRCPINAIIFYNIFRNGTSFYNNLFSVNLQKMLQNFGQTLVGKKYVRKKTVLGSKTKKRSPFATKRTNASNSYGMRNQHYKNTFSALENSLYRMCQLLIAIFYSWLHNRDNRYLLNFERPFATSRN